MKYRPSGNTILNTYKVKNKFQLEEEGTGIIFLWNFRSRCSSWMHKIS